MPTKCKGADCNRQSSFNEEGKKPAFCALHAEDYMVDVRNKRCKHEPCNKRASFNDPGSKVALFCKQHAEDGTVNIKNKNMACTHPGGCTSRQSYGYWADGIASRCKKHKDDLAEASGLVINYKQQCRAAGVKGCNGIVNWGPDGEHPTHCTKHGAPKAAEGFVAIPKKSNKGGKAPASRPRRGVSGGGGGGSSGGAAKKARKAQPRRRVDTSSEESESESEADLDSSDDDDNDEEEGECKGEDDSAPEPEPVKKRRIIWL